MGLALAPMAWLLKSWTILCVVLLEVPEIIRPFLFGTNLIALVNKDGGLEPIPISNTLRRVVAKCAESKVLDEGMKYFGKTEFGCGTRKGAGILAHLFSKHTWKAVS